MFSLESITQIDIAKQALRDVRLYKDMIKKLWKRGKILFHQKMEGSHSFTVEYFPSVWVEFAKEKALFVYSSVFWVIPKMEDIVLIEKENLLSGIKVYFDDSCVDLSFKNIEYKLQK
jgi:hypothetical protein